MFTSFNTALSALKANSTAIDVVGNNLANMNTAGFKGSAVSFRDLVAQSMGAGLGETQVGFGTGNPFTQRQFTQGAIQTTDGLLDAAIQGDGFFILKDSQDGTLYTRAGNFQVDKLGNLMTMTGEKVQGWMQNAAGAVTTAGAIGNIVVPVGTLKSVQATANMSIDLNLDASAGAGDTFATPITVIDSLGTSHVLTITFTKSSTANEWGYDVTIPGADVNSTDPTVSLTTGTVTFDSTGKMTSPDLTNPTVTFEIPEFTDGATPNQSIIWSFYTTNDAPRLTQYAQASQTSSNSQDGSSSATLTSVGMGNGGEIIAQYSNGVQQVVGQVALASIRNPESLIAAGDNNFRSSAKTANAAVGMPDTGGRGSVVGSALEASTVDIAKQFTNLIIYQRGYQANGKVITTVDELSQDTINLKR